MSDKFIKVYEFKIKRKNNKIKLRLQEFLQS